MHALALGASLMAPMISQLYGFNVVLSTRLSIYVHVQHHVLPLVKHIAMPIRQNISSVAIWQTIDKILRYIRFCDRIHLFSMLHCRHFLQSCVSGCQSVQRDSLTCLAYNSSSSCISTCQKMRPLLNQRSSLVRVLLCFQSRMNFSPATKTHFGSPLVHRRIWVGDGKNQNSRQHDLSYFCLSKLGIHVDWISSCGPHNKANVSSQHSGMCSFTRASHMRPLLYFQSSGALPLNVYHTFRFLCDACHASSCFLSMMSCSSRLL